MSRRRLELHTSAAEMDLICWAISEGLCSRLSLATAMGWSISKLNMTLRSRRPAPAGMMEALQQHLTRTERRILLVEVARRWGVDPGEVFRHQARQEVLPEVWGEVVDLASARAARAEHADVVLAEAA